MVLARKEEQTQRVPMMSYNFRLLRFVYCNLQSFLCVSQAFTLETLPVK